MTIIAAWQAACAVAMVLFGYAIGWLVYSLYTSLFGDVQESYATYERLTTYTVYFAVTGLATAVAMTLLAVLERRRATLRAMAATFIAWHAAAMAALAASHEFGLSWLFSRLDWALFGVPDSLYSFRNLVLPRILAWVVSTTPAIAVVLWLRTRLVPVSPTMTLDSQAIVATPLDRPEAAIDENPYAAPQTDEPRQDQRTSFRWIAYNAAMISLWVLLWLALCILPWLIASLAVGGLFG